MDYSTHAEVGFFFLFVFLITEKKISEKKSLTMFFSEIFVVENVFD